MKSTLIGLLWLATVLAIAGCSIKVRANKETEADIGGHQLIVRPGCTFTSNSSLLDGNIATYIFECDEVSAIVQNEKLIVNEMKYGELKTGEKILIENGKVYLSGKPGEYS